MTSTVTSATRYLITFRRLKYLSFLHSAIYLCLLVVWRTPTLHSAKYTLGMAHGVGWIAMSVLVLIALRLGVISLWLAVMVAVIGGLGPFAGSACFVIEERRLRKRRTRLTLAQPTPQPALRLERSEELPAEAVQATERGY